MTVQDYLNLITSNYANQPNFTATISLDVSPAVQVQTLLASMIPIFDIATPPIGNQLDIIGQWVGVTRNVAIPITGVFFTWDGAANVGWDFGTWAISNDETTITVLPDDAYLTLILAKIAANNWDGTTDGAYAIWNSLFTQFTILIQDYQNMSYALAIVGGVPDSLTLALITGGYIPLRPEGVLITDYFIPVNSGSLFGWDLDSSFIQGWDSGSWAMEIAPT